ncbi:hypothetical protein BH23VER1_BH23VER1_11940 [soil metagenome]
MPKAWTPFSYGYADNSDLVDTVTRVTDSGGGSFPTVGTATRTFEPFRDVLVSVEIKTTTALARLHHLEGWPISAVCEEHEITPTLFYQWQKTFFEKGTW